MTEQLHRFKAMIDGKAYTIVGPATTEHMRAVTQVLNTEYAQLKQQLPKVSKEDAAMLMAFNAISDQLKLKAALNEAELTNQPATDSKTSQASTTTSDGDAK